jgi:uncharacterized damage-inducible protein DinB
VESAAASGATHVMVAGVGSCAGSAATERQGDPPLFDYTQTAVMLRQTPAVLKELLLPLPDEQWHATEAAGTWSPFQVLCHLVHAEIDDWVPRVRLILEEGEAVEFEPFDREGGFARYGAMAPSALLDEFARLRQENLNVVAALNITPDDLSRRGRHPALGAVTLEQLLATWVTHDLAHLAQIARVLVRYHGAWIGPWRAYFSLLADREGST